MKIALHRASLGMAAMAGVCVAACTVYPHPILENVGAHAPKPVGVVQFLEESPSARYRLIIVHGMGTTAPGYASSWMADFARAAQLTPAAGAAAAPFEIGPTHDGKPVPESMRPYLRVYGFTHPSKGQLTDLRAYEITWSPMTAPYKAALESEEKPPEYDRQRAHANAWLKFQLMDDRLLDAVMYAGAYRVVLKQALRDAICRTLRDDEHTPVATLTPCNWTQISAQQAASLRLIFFTHSLGGRMVFDVLTELLSEPDSPAHTVLLNGFQIYMFANQLSLLNLADHADPFDPNEDTALRRFSNQLNGVATQRNVIVHGQLVAFSDPNDVLSYQVPRGMVFDAGLGRRAFNVTISNAPTWFGLIENPTAAHLRYLASGRIWNAIADGIY